MSFLLNCIIQLGQIDTSMNKFLLLICFLLSLNCFSQARKIKIKKEKEKVKPKLDKGSDPHGGTFDLYYGNRIFKENYYHQFNSIHKIDLKSPPTLVGIGISGYNSPVNRNFNFTSQVNYYKIIPTKIFIDDSLNTKFSGYVFGLGIGFGVSTLNRNLGLNVYAGFNTGRSTLSKNDFISQKNQFFSPKVTVQTKIIVKRIALSFMIEAENDISNPAWKQTFFDKKEPYLLQPFHQTCITGLISLGYKLTK